MDFGKPADPTSIDFSLPDDGPLTALTLKRQTPEPHSPTQLYLGGTGWSDRAFVGEVYPPGTRPPDYLAAYGKQFNCVELNATFYRVPDRRQCLKWYAATPDDFRFCPKIHQAISQAGDLAAANSRVLDFAKAVQAFEHKLGPCFVQLPSDFTTQRADVVRAFIARWPPTLRLAVEFRHASWFAESAGADVFADLHAAGVGAVITDVGGRRDVAHLNLTAAPAFVRWVGCEHPSDEARLARWAERIARWVAGGLREAA